MNTDRLDLGRLRRAVTRLDVLAVAVVCLPIAWAALRAATTDWVPIGDDAYFPLRAMDVGTSHHPLLGAWSSGSIDVDRMVNNLGPMQLDLLAPFTRWTPYGGTAIGVAVVQIAAIATVGWLVHDLAGRRGTVAAMVPVALMTWVVGSEMLITPRQHQFLVPAYLCFLVAAWAVCAGRTSGVVPLVVSASLLTQTHLSYPVLVAMVGSVAFVGQAIAWRASTDRRRYARAWTLAAGIAVVLWLQTAIDQLWGWGNFTAVLRASGGSESPSTWRAAELVGGALFSRALYLRRGFALFEPELMDRAWAAVLLVVLVAGLAGGCVWSVREHRRTAASGLAIGVTALVAAVVNASRLPVTFFGLTPANYRWLWPTVAFLLIGVAVAIVVYSRERQLVYVGMGSVVVLAALNLPRSIQLPDAQRYLDEQAVTVEMIDQISQVELQGPVVIDQQHMFFGHPYGYPLAIALRDGGVDYRMEGNGQQRRFGSDRVADGSEPRRLVLWAGDDARARRDDPGLVVYVDSYSPLAIVLEQQ